MCDQPLLWGSGNGNALICRHRTKRSRYAAFHGASQTARRMTFESARLILNFTYSLLNFQRTTSCDQSPSCRSGFSPASRSLRTNRFPSTSPTQTGLPGGVREPTVRLTQTSSRCSSGANRRTFCGENLCPVEAMVQRLSLVIESSLRRQTAKPNNSS